MGNNKQDQAPAEAAPEAAAAPAQQASGSPSGSPQAAPGTTREGGTAKAARLPLQARLEAALDGWYAGHHHRGVTTGTPVIHADDKAALYAAVLKEASTQQQE